jgi:hypothetical protein
MKLRFTAGTVAGLLSLGLLAGTAHAAGPADVTIRVEGQAQTVLPETALRTTTTPVRKDSDPTHTCPGTTAAGALERATAGDWTAQWFAPPLGFGPLRIKTQNTDATGASGTYWSFWLNGRFSDTGICGQELQEGDDVLLFVDCYGTGCVSPKPLGISGVPSRPRPGSQATVNVTESTAVSNYPNPTTTTSAPAPGATVNVGGRAYTTGSDGSAIVSFPTRGPVDVQATKADTVRTAVIHACVTDGADNVCGSPPPCETSGHDGRCGTTDTEEPHARIKGLVDGRHYDRGPRLLHGTVTADPSGLRAVKLRLTRRRGDRCWIYSGHTERFKARKCGKRSWFKIGDRQDWSYLLPARLKRGKYILDVTAIDKAGNRDALERKRSRVLFWVR